MLLLALAGMFLLAFLPTYAFLPALIRALRKHKHLLRADMNKPNKPLVPSFGGIALVTGFLFALLSAILVDRIMGLNGLNLGLLLPALLSTALCALLGLVDDLLEIPRRFMKPLLVLYASIPMMALTELTALIYLPFFGNLDLGMAYYLFFVPCAIIFCSNAVNILSTYNGLETGLGLIAALALGAVAWLRGSMLGLAFALPLIAVLLAFYPFNRFPAKIFLGNMGTLFIGAALAITAIIGKMEAALVIVMVPYFLHFLLYSRNGYAWKPNMWGVPLKNGRLRARYSKAYGLMQWVLARGPQTEKQVVNQVFAFETVFALAAVALEWAGKG